MLEANRINNPNWSAGDDEFTWCEIVHACVHCAVWDF